METAREKLTAATKYTNDKGSRNNTDKLCMIADVDYQAAVWETTGGLPVQGMCLMKSLKAKVANNLNTPEPEVANRFWQMAAVTSQKANYRAFAKQVTWRSQAQGNESKRSEEYLKKGSADHHDTDEVC